MTKFLDLQVNGYAGVDFNGEDWTLDQIVSACQRLAQDGVQGILATVITDRLDLMCDRLRRLASACHESPEVARMIRGLHVEGPFLNEQSGYIGAHPSCQTKPANLQDMQKLLEATNGLARVVTLAPERDLGFAVTRWLVDRGMVVAAGHCNPTFDELRGSIDAGLSMFTHLGNGCPLQIHRHDNVIQRALSLADHLWLGFIADDVHVPFVALGNYHRAAGLDRCFVVTDAISAAGQGPGKYQLGNRTVIVDDQLATWAEGRDHLMGSAGTMPHSAKKLEQDLGLSAADVKQLTWENPCRILGLPWDRSA